jgi:hypothetical protein
VFLKHTKVTLVVVMVSLILTCFCGQALAEGMKKDGSWVDDPWSYEVTNNESKIVFYYREDIANGRDVIIPNTLGGHPVTSIEDFCFYALRGSITGIEIPDSITELNAYSHLLALEKIKIPQTVTGINDEAFWGCSRLAKISIPEGVKTMGEGAFGGCTALWGVFGGEGITSIGDRAFYGCSSLWLFDIPEGVTTIGDKTFAGCTSMRRITIPEGITSIGKEAFLGSGLNTITFESSETEIYDSKDTIPEATKIIGYRSSTAQEYAKKYDRTFQDINEVSGDGITTQDIMKTAIVLLVLACFVLVLIIARISRQNKQLLKTIEDSGSEAEEANLPG